MGRPPSRERYGAAEGQPDAGAGAAASDADRLTKRMSLSAAEFRAGVAALMPGSEVGAAWPGALPVHMRLGAGSVELGYAPLAPVRLGGLLELPQALVSLTFSEVGASERADFERRFWIVFQRGGG